MALHVSELIFPEQTSITLSKTLGDLKKRTFSVHNRLKSILEDAAFVEGVESAYGRPLVANERCGSWYINPSRKAASAYFKSTDGHTGVWKFSSRRLNTHLFQWIGKHDGCIIVDSTRRGKRMPDALSKTVPIWCCVLNRALFPDVEEGHDLFTPPQVVSSSEHAQILALLDGFVLSFLDLTLDLASLRQLITKPLRPIWITPESHIKETTSIYDDFHPVICCTASRRIAGGEISEGGYIQGSGDDTENWAYGLTPPLFWANSELLLQTPESEIRELIEQLVLNNPPTKSSLELTSISPTSSLYILAAHNFPDKVSDERAIFIFLSSEITEVSAWEISSNYLKVGLGPHKIGSRSLRTTLPNIMGFLSKRLKHLQSGDTVAAVNIFVGCTNGTDHSVGVALAILCSLYDEEGRLMQLGQQPTGNFDKTMIKQRLGWIMTSISEANPSRSTLQSVNSYLMERPP